MKRSYIVWALLVVLGLSLVVELGQDRNAGSTYSARPHGARALLLFFQKRHLEAKPWLHPFDKLEGMPGKATLFLISPPQFAKGSALTAWLEKGNQVVLMDPADTRETADFLWRAGLLQEAEKKRLQDSGRGGRLFKRLEQTIYGDKESMPMDCSGRFPRSCRGVSQISLLRAPLEGLPVKRSALIAGTPEAPLLAHTQVGKGGLWYFSDSKPARNEFIDKFDNLRMLYQIASVSPVILFDEFHHGYTAPVSSELRGSRDSVWVFAGYLAFFLVMLALTRAVCFGPALPVAEEQASSSVEFATAFGLLCCEHGASGVLRWYAGTWRRRAEERYSLSRRLDNAAFIEELAQKQGLGAEKAASLARALQCVGGVEIEDASLLSRSVSELESVFER